MYAADADVALDLLLQYPAEKKHFYILDIFSVQLEGLHFETIHQGMTA